MNRLRALLAATLAGSLLVVIRKRRRSPGPVVDDAADWWRARPAGARAAATPHEEHEGASAADRCTPDVPLRRGHERGLDPWGGARGFSRQQVIGAFRGNGAAYQGTQRNRQELLLRMAQPTAERSDPRGRPPSPRPAWLAIMRFGAASRGGRRISNGIVWCG